ncbi:predicted protein [Histoplasma mississippiense (nom. inval.)]|uniref:predicted protein n=1 Tax=Ajellomyces capsulatus (strain NAm1 / WU24) TaxID=2059318 RepID=UPI000157C92E|nr:predicted protein [Histoplasma mississippiense (nom. inval.)]EDN09241.1 predicted protein [Histoplasma mississippiense (nom. inval.)]
MLLSAIVFAVSLLVSGIQAQSFDPQSVPDDLKLSWCDAQLAACPKVCKSFASVNKCDANDLSFTCTCGDGSTPDLTKYMNTIPYFICTATYGQCVKSHPDDLSGPESLQDEPNKVLGNHRPSQVCVNHEPDWANQRGQTHGQTHRHTHDHERASSHNHR